MRKNRCGDGVDDDDEIHPLIKEGYLVQILVWLPVKSLLRFKSVCKSWLALIESSFFIDLHTSNTFNSSSSSSKFGSFILHASVDKRTTHDIVREHELLMLSESESESGSGGPRWLWSGCYNDITCRDTVQLDDFDDQVFKVDDDEIDLVLKFDNLGFPPCYKFVSYAPSIVIIGSSNGLVCLYSKETTQVSLWNPATRKFRHLPKNTIPSEDSFGPLLTFASFGFDVETKDFKVMLLTRFRPRRRMGYYQPGPAGSSSPKECLCRVEVYSLSTDSWSLLEGITSLPGDPLAVFSGNVLYLNGSCFFLAKFIQPYFPEYDRFLISFDFTKGIITTILLPYHHPYQKLYLTYFGQKIALYTSEYHENVVVDDDDDDNDTRIFSYEDFNIWVLHEHGSNSDSANKESWTKLHSFRIEHRIPGEWSRPKGISNDGKFALLETICSRGLCKKMKLYNLVTKEVKKDFLFCNMVMSKAIAYKPSLVSIKPSLWR